MAQKMPRRDSKGRFVKAGARKRTRSKSKRRASPRRNPPRKANGQFAKRGGARRSTARRSSPRRNAPRPKLPDLVGTLMDGTVMATQVLVGKAAVRSIPDLTGLPKQGIPGLAVQAGVALATGYVATMFLSPNAAAAITAGGLSAPLETFLVAQNVPWIGRALAPTTANAAVGAYVSRRRLKRPTGVGAYVPRRNRVGVGAYVPRSHAMSGYAPGYM